MRKICIEHLICKYAYMEIFFPPSLPFPLPLHTQNCSFWPLNTFRDLPIPAYPIFYCRFSIMVSHSNLITPINLRLLADTLHILFTNKLSMHLLQWNTADIIDVNLSSTSTQPTRILLFKERKNKQDRREVSTMSMNPFYQGTCNN